MSRFAVVFLTGFIVAAVLLHWSPASFAVVISVTNDPTIVPQFGRGNSGDGNNLTVDSNTGLQWLDVTLTKDLTAAQVIEGGTISAVGLYPGFRYATEAEVSQFWLDAGLSAPFTTLTIQPTAALQLLQNEWGRTDPSGKITPTTTLASADDASFFSGGSIFDILLSLPSARDPATVGTSTNYASALVRVTPTPEPATMTLLATGIFLLAGMRWRRRA